ncbi:MAG: type II secretion system F family protein [Acidimicrobiia bacterium]
MPTTYAYKAQDEKGKLKQGKLSAASSDAAVRELQSKGLKPVTLEETEAKGMSAEVRIPGITDRVSAKEVAVFSRQFATMISSGLSLLRSLAILAEQTENTTLAEVILDVKNDVEKGESLSQALEKHPKVFTQLYVSMVKAGETGGLLDDSLLRLADTLEAQVALKNKIRSAMMYPAAVAVLVVLIVGAMLLFVVPMFEDLYADLGGELPVPTRILLAISAVVQSWWWLVLALGVAGWFVFKRWVATDAGRMAWDSIKLRMPIFGKLVHKTSLARFSHTMSSLIRTGVPILQAMEIVADTSGNAVVADAVMASRASVSEGESIAKPMADRKVFPPMVVQMIAVGEETGALDQMLQKIGDFYEDEVETMVDGLTSLIEPLLIVVLGGVVGGMRISLYLPRFNIINLIQ